MSRLNSRNKHSKDKYIFFLIAAVFLIILTLLIRDGSIIRIKFSNSDSQENISQKRVLFNFEEILSSSFNTYSFPQAGFSIQYPQSTEFTKIPKESIVNKYDLPFVDGRGISLVSQIQEGTELYDGMQILILIYLKGTLTLEEIVPPVNNTSSYKVLERKIVTINGNDAYKTIECCYVSDMTTYYLKSKDNKYLIEISVFSAGPDEKKFDEIADKIIRTIKLK